MSTRIYITALFLIPGNPKRSPEHYNSLITGSLHYAKDSILYFFSNSNQIKESIEDACQNFNITLIWEYLQIEELPAHKILLKSEPTVNINSFEYLHSHRLVPREKIFEHHFIDSKAGSDTDTFKRMQAVWLSKIYLVNTVISKENTSQEYCWFDASVARFENRPRSNFSKIIINNSRIHHYPSIMNFFGKTLPLNASVLMGTRDAWRKLIRIYHQQLEPLIHCGLPIDEEIVLMNCLVQYPELFHCINKAGKRTLIHKFIGRLLFPVNGFILRCINYDNRLLK